MEDGELSALFDKLREMIALRTLGPADPRPGSPALSLDPPTARLRALAARFPGALRELDQAPLERLSARLAEVTVALAGGPSPDWALPVSRYHGWLRAALRLRAEAARDTAAAGVWAAAYHPSFPGDPPRDHLDPEALRALIAPPNGRLVGVAIDLAARATGVAPSALAEWIEGR